MVQVRKSCLLIKLAFAKKFPLRKCWRFSILKQMENGCLAPELDIALDILRNMQRSKFWMFSAGLCAGHSQKSCNSRKNLDCAVVLELTTTQMVSKHSKRCLSLNTCVDCKWNFSLEIQVKSYKFESLKLQHLFKFNLYYKRSSGEWFAAENHLLTTWILCITHHY